MKVRVKFGRLPSVEGVDFALPDDPALNFELLRGGGDQGSESRLEIFFGAPVWNAKTWRGSIYPEHLAAGRFLEAYARYFSCVELNTSHYRIPTSSTVNKWRRQVGEDFLFCPKIFKGISHARFGLKDYVLVKEWFRFIEDLGPHAGPSFLQLPPYFDNSHKQELFEFIERWPREIPLALELRHPDWFDNHQVRPALVRYLHSRGVALVHTDVAGRRDVLHTSLSDRSTLLRFVGNDLHPSDETRATAWTERFELWRRQGLRRLFLFIHEPDDVAVPAMTKIFLGKLQTHPRLDVRQPEPPAQTGQLSLGM